jgi:PLP dependent protein
MTNLEVAIEKIEKARLLFDAKHIVQIVAVSKGVDADRIKELYGEGQRAYGESKVQDLAAKAEILQDLPLDWHFIGRIQTNKINKLLDVGTGLIHSVDSFETAIEIDNRAKEKGVVQRALLQINSANEESKAGVSPETINEEYLKIKELKNIALCGIMTIGAHTEDAAIIQKSFEITYKIFDSLKKEGATICSMGMSSDYELAIRSGSNLVRLGSILFK